MQPLAFPFCRSIGRFWKNGESRRVGSHASHARSRQVCLADGVLSQPRPPRWRTQGETVSTVSHTVAAARSLQPPPAPRVSVAPLRPRSLAHTRAGWANHAASAGSNVGDRGESSRTVPRPAAYAASHAARRHQSGRARDAGHAHSGGGHDVCVGEMAMQVPLVRYQSGRSNLRCPNPNPPPSTEHMGTPEAAMCGLRRGDARSGAAHGARVGDGVYQSRSVRTRSAKMPPTSPWPPESTLRPHVDNNKVGRHAAGFGGFVARSVNRM